MTQQARSQSQLESRVGERDPSVTTEIEVEIMYAISSMPIDVEDGSGTVRRLDSG